MVTLIETPRVAFVSGSNLPASSPFSLSRLILPILCVSLGVSVGTATGLTLALVNAANRSVSASSNNLQSDAAPAANLAANSSPAQATQLTVAASPIAAPSATAANADSNPTVEMRQAKLSSAPTSSERSATSFSKVEVALNTTPDALKPATFKLDGKTYHVARMMILPSAKPEQHETAAAQLAPTTALNTAPLSLDTPATANLYTEGDLTVSDYNASTRTLQTSDGRTFVLGTTVAAGNAISWDSYRSDVHYRCDQNGSCMLMRAGVVAPDAKLI